MTEVDEWDKQFEAPAAAEAEAESFEPRFANADEWVTEWLAPLHRREPSGAMGGDTVQWCAEWWRHDEAVDRLTSVWWAWEHARRDKAGGAMANWWLLVMDPMWRILTGEHGPFARCTTQHTEALPELKVTPPPPGWWEAEEPGPAEAGSEG